MENVQFTITRDENYLEHHGVKGMRKGYRKDGKPSTWNPTMPQPGDDNYQTHGGRKWGVREFKNEDGSLDEDEENKKKSSRMKKAAERVNKNRERMSKMKAKDASSSSGHARGAEVVRSVLMRKK